MGRRKRDLDDDSDDVEAQWVAARAPKWASSSARATKAKTLTATEAPPPAKRTRWTGEEVELETAVREPPKARGEESLPRKAKSQIASGPSRSRIAIEELKEEFKKKQAKLSGKPALATKKRGEATSSASAAPGAEAEAEGGGDEGKRSKSSQKRAAAAEARDRKAKKAAADELRKKKQKWREQGKEAGSGRVARQIAKHGDDTKSWAKKDEDAGDDDDKKRKIRGFTLGTSGKGGLKTKEDKEARKEAEKRKAKKAARGGRAGGEGKGKGGGRGRGGGKKGGRGRGGGKGKGRGR